MQRNREEGRRGGVTAYDSGLQQVRNDYSKEGATMYLTLYVCICVHRARHH